MSQNDDATRSETGPDAGTTWDQLGSFEQVRRIERVLDERVRPMLSRDGGDLEVVDLRDHELIIRYGGACHGCPHALGATLMFVKGALAEALGVDLEVRVAGA